MPKLVMFGIIASSTVTAVFVVLFILSLFFDSISEWTGIFLLGILIGDIILSGLVVYSIYRCNEKSGVNIFRKL